METIYLVKGKFYQQTTQGLIKFNSTSDLLRQYKIVQIVSK